VSTADLPAPLAWRLPAGDAARFAAEGKHCDHRGCRELQVIVTWRRFWSKAAGRVLLSERFLCDQHGQEFADRHHIEVEPPPKPSSR
jgi:hypothetical protein